MLSWFQAAKEEWSQTLWVNLNVQVLQEGIDGYLKSLRKLPKHVRSLPVAYHLEMKMKAFKDSIPLLLDLKNEALRDRSGRVLSVKQGGLALSVLRRSYARRRSPGFKAPTSFSSAVAEAWAQCLVGTPPLLVPGSSCL